MDDPTSDYVILFNCEDCQAEFPDHYSLTEHRTSCDGGIRQSPATRPELPRNAPAEDAGSESDVLQSLDIQSILADADAEMQLKEQAYESVVALLKQTSRVMVEVNRINWDSFRVALGEECGKLRSAIESNSCKSNSLLYQTIMNYATGKELLSRTDERFNTVLQTALKKQEATIRKLEDAMKVERSNFECVARLLSL